MPTFFDDNDLTDEQEERYDDALEKYSEIQHNNGEKQKILLQKANKLTPRLEREIDFIKNYHQPSGQSSLFFRLLQGKDPLPEPPPTNFSYPWYEVIEDTGPWHVIVSGSSTLDSYINIPFFSKKQQFIAINQCFWAVRKANPAGKKFLKINNPENGQEVQSIILLKPEFVVFYHGWPDYLLKLGRKKIQGRRENIMNMEFSLDTLGTNPIILNVQQTGEHFIEDEQEKRIALSQKPSDTYTLNERLLAKSYEEPLALPNSPSDWDWVEAEIDTWVLEKI